MSTNEIFENVALSILPECEESLRQVVLAQLLHSAKVASEVAPSSWSATLFVNGFRLNVGQVEVLVLIDRMVLINLAISAEDKSVQSLDLLPSNYKSMPLPQSRYVADIIDFANDFRRLQPYHDAFVQRAAVTKNGKPRQGSNFARSHSPELMEYAALYLGTTARDNIAHKHIFPFVLGDNYRHTDILKMIGLPVEATSQSWFADYTAHGDD